MHAGRFSNRLLAEVHFWLNCIHLHISLEVHVWLIEPIITLCLLLSNGRSSTYKIKLYRTDEHL